VFGLFTVLYQRGLIRRFAIAQAVAEQHSEQLRETEMQLAHSEKMKALGTLTAGVAHDFKNLLSVIRMSSGLIRRDAAEDPDILEEADAISQAVEQGDQVIKAMLGYSRTSATGPGLVDVPEVIEGTVALLEQQFLSGVTLGLEIERGLPKVKITEGALEQVLLNLIVNASEAMDGNGELDIRAWVGRKDAVGNGVLEPGEGERYLLVEVADVGPGMSDETMHRIFEPFFTTKTLGSEKGTGLGLATVYKICRENGIGLLVDTEEGNGTRFVLEIPG